MKNELKEEQRLKVLLENDWNGLRKRVLEGLRMTGKTIPIVRSRK